MRALSGAGDLQGSRYPQSVTGLHEGPGILAPFLIIKVNGKKMATVILQQGVDPNGMITGQMAEDHLVRYRKQQAVTTIRAFDPRLRADTHPPLVGAGGGVT